MYLELYSSMHRGTTTKETLIEWTLLTKISMESNQVHHKPGGCLVYCSWYDCSSLLTSGFFGVVTRDLGSTRPPATMTLGYATLMACAFVLKTSRNKNN